MDRGGVAVKRISTFIVMLGLVAFGATAASAADLRARPAYKAEPVSYVPYYNWTGFYIGAHIGGAWADKSWSAPGVGALGGHTGDGFIGGGQIGYNWQTGPWVFGIEADFTWADLKGSNVDLAFPTFTNTTTVDFFGSIAGRVGYAWNNWMLYLKLGGAWANDDYRTSNGIVTQTGSDTRWGWMIGTGVEYGLTPNWSVKLEYNYMDFGTDRVILQPGAFNTDIDQYIHVLKVGVNYRFGGFGKAPVPARY
jgi:outer membrane immunogenic protein